MTLKSSSDIEIVSNAKWAFTTRRTNRNDVFALSKEFDSAVAGDLILCEILEIGHHKNIQLAEGRNSASYPGDYVVLCLGDRYAPDQYLCRAELKDGPMQLAAGGGIIGIVEAAHKRTGKPTSVRPLGLLTNAAGKAMNINDYALPEQRPDIDATVIGVFGASMNSGKTTAAASIAHGLQLSGFEVAGIKATGTGAFGDFNAFQDAGIPVSDFTDVGMATTYKMPMERIERGFDTLVATAAANGANMVVVEIADGVFQKETRAILSNSKIRDRMDGILFAAPDALGAYGGVTILEQYGLSPFAISGMVSCSPLATAEAAEVTGLPILSREDLWDKAIISNLVAPFIRNSKLNVAA